MTKTIIFMFSGQGSQYYHMGKSLYENNSIFRKWLNRLDHMVSDAYGISIGEKIYNPGKKIHDPFNRTLYSHPAIFMIEYSLAQLLFHDGIEPDGVFGVSMGEFAAATIAGVLSLDEAIEAVVEQAIQIEELCEKGKMYAVLDNVSIYNNAQFLHDFSELAAVNFSSHFVISVKNENTSIIERYLSDHQICYEKLPVSHAFHSSLLDPAEESYKKVLKKIKYQTPSVLFYSNVYAESLKEIPKNYFWEIARRPILFQQSMQHLNDKDEYIYIDIGPSGTLATFVKYNLGLQTTVRSFPIITPFGNEYKNLETVKNLYQNLA
jgi:acyl transferase domain-containing protein